jgi:hypothetical protein
MDLSTIFQFIPYASRLAAAAQTIERLEKDPEVQEALKVGPTIARLEKDPGVQDILKLVQELGPLLAKSQVPAQHG